MVWFHIIPFSVLALLEKSITLSFMTSLRGWPQKYNLLSFLYNLGLFVNTESTSTITLSHLFMPHIIQAQGLDIG